MKAKVNGMDPVAEHENFANGIPWENAHKSKQIKRIGRSTSTKRGVEPEGMHEDEYFDVSGDGADM